jgi:hypothetical protein
VYLQLLNNRSQPPQAKMAFARAGAGHHLAGDYQ